MPHFIIINGPPAIGKSTVASLLHAEIDRSILVQGDVMRRMLSGYRTHREESITVRNTLITAVAGTSLKNGSDVILEQTYYKQENLDQLRTLAEGYGAEIHEFLLWADWEIVQQRHLERPPRPNTPLTMERIREIWEELVKLKAERPQMTVIDTSDQKPEQTVGAILNHFSDS